MAQREGAISIPRSVLLTIESLDELEDWLLANNPDFIAEMRRIRVEESGKGKGYTLDELRREWNIQS